ncbi:substrate-binding domain-containing protein [Streptomyces sp. NPDC006906]|uniref:substrate-binding domain-containing protein n=1 Tax=unclassified Streptomyces TaxID=2593676 RepID=UPI0033D892AD
MATGTAVAASDGLSSFSESCGDSAVHLSVVASPDIAPAVRSLAEQARAYEVKADRLCPAVHVRARGAHKGAEALAAGDEPDFQVRLPDSGRWLTRAKGFGESIPVSASDPVATSPEAVAVVPSASRDLGRPRKTYPWAELVAGALGPDRVRLGTADPARPW